MLKRQIVLWGVITAMAGCGGTNTTQVAPTGKTSPPSPSAAGSSVEDLAARSLGEMLQVARSGDFEKYVDDYYGETDKFRTPADRDALVRRFTEKWGESLVEGLDRAAKLPVKIDGDKALFLDGDEPVFILHRAEDGAWKFHL